MADTNKIADVLLENLKKNKSDPEAFEKEKTEREAKIKPLFEGKAPPALNRDGSLVDSDKK